MTDSPDNIVVLVADDEPSTLALVASHVRSKGYTVLEASDGDQAWQLAHEHLPDLVILDVMMPGMSGWEVCRKIREAVSLAHTGVVMLTGIGENLNEMTSPLYGADTYIDKPFEFSELDVKIRETLERRQKGAMGRPDAEAVAASLDEPSSPSSESAAESEHDTSVSDRPTAPSVKRTKPKPATKSAKTGAEAAAPSAKKAKAAKKTKAAAPAKRAAGKKKKTKAKVAPKKAAPKKVAPKKPAAKKAAPKKAPAKKAPKKAPAKKAAPKKAAKKVPKKAAPKKAPAKKAPKKAAPKAAARSAAQPKKGAPASRKKSAPAPKKAAKKKSRPERVAAGTDNDESIEASSGTAEAPHGELLN